MYRRQRFGTIFTLFMACSVLVTGIATATPVTTPGLTGERSEGSGLTVVGAWAGDIPPVKIAWDITDLGSAWHYQYTFTFDPTRQGGFSHWDLQLSETCFNIPTEGPATLADENCVYNEEGVNEALIFAHFGIGLVDDNFWPAGGSSFYGVKLHPLSGSTSPVIFEFDSNRNPVWGSFMAKSGGQGAVGAHNNGLTNPTSVNEIDFIARPNGDHHDDVPEPATIALLGIGGVLAIVRKRFTA